MKRNITHLMMLLIVIATGLSCTKRDTTPPEIAIEDKDLTACPKDANCQYLFTEHADFNAETFSPKSGNKRLFWADVMATVYGSRIYIIAPMEGTGFLLGKAEVLAGGVQINAGCPTCYMVPYTLVDGYVKGVNLTPGNRADQSKWLLEIKVVLQRGDDKQTIFVKQHFFPNFVMN